MPFFCHIHNGLYVKEEGVEGCQHEKCQKYREIQVPPVGVVTAVVPGGANDTPTYRFHKDFDKGLDKYATARKNGLEPRSTTVAAVDAAEREAASQRRALKKLEKMGVEANEVKTVKAAQE